MIVLGIHLVVYPVITTRVAGASEILEDRLKEFILEDPHDVKELSTLIRKWLDSSAKEELSISGRKIAGAYTLEANAHTIEHLCQNVKEANQHV